MGTRPRTSRQCVRQPEATEPDQPVVPEVARARTVGFCVSVRGSRLAEFLRLLEGFTRADQSHIQTNSQVRLVVTPELVAAVPKLKKYGTWVGGKPRLWMLDDEAPTLADASR